MNGKFLQSAITLSVLIIALWVSKANASLVVGENYVDDNQVLWEYVGFYDLAEGPAWDGLDDQTTSDNATPYNGLDAALVALTALANTPLADIAISAYSAGFSIAALPNVVAGDNVVNHMAWYDAFDAQDGTHRASESAQANNGGADGKYDASGDISAFVADRATLGFNLNYVFKRVTEVSEPSTLAIFALALCGLGARRFKR